MIEDKILDILLSSKLFFAFWLVAGIALALFASNLLSIKHTRTKI